jgi:hypothetical protein
MLLVAGILYILFSSSELQEWNSPIENKHIHELQKLYPQQNTDTALKQETQYVIQHETYDKAEKAEK